MSIKERKIDSEVLKKHLFFYTFWAEWMLADKLGMKVLFDYKNLKVTASYK